MIRSFALAACLVGVAFTTIPADACVPEPMRAGESAEEYKARLAQQRERWEMQREPYALQRAAAIFIAREATREFLDEEMAKARTARPTRRSERPVPPPPLMVLRPPESAYFRPVAWFRGAGSDTLIPLTVDWTSCGPSLLGDTGSGKNGALYIFFADAGPISRQTLFEAIAVDGITDPALLEFAANYRRETATLAE